MACHTPPQPSAFTEQAKAERPVLPALLQHSTWRAHAELRADFWPSSEV